MMKNKKRALKRFLCVISAVTVLAGMLVLTVNLTKAWIENNVNPAFQASQVQLNTSPGLIMTIDSTQTDLIDLNDYLTDYKSKPFILTEMTSVDGNVMYVRVNNTNEDVKLELADDSDKNVSYIDFTLQLTAETGTSGKTALPIYLGDADDATLTYLKPNAGAHADSIKPIRMFLSYEYSYVDGNQQTVTVSGSNIFAYDTSYQTMAVQTIDNNSHLIASNGYALQDVDLLSDYYYDEDNPSNSNPWFTLPDGAIATVKMKIWLEGCDGNYVNGQYVDGNCVDAISGSSLQMKLTFFTPKDTSSAASSSAAESSTEAQ